MNSALQQQTLHDWKGIPFSRSISGLPAGPVDLTTLQVNLGKRCNQACLHCHVDASPSRTESMSRPIAEQCIDLLERIPSLEILDLTGGAPEMNDHFRFLVESARRLGKTVIDRCNLTILSEPGFEDLASFLQQHQVEIIASLPCYTRETVDRQRGHGVFDRSLAGLKELNQWGYGTTLPLHLVYNPSGATLPGDQALLEADYKTQLSALGIQFTSLFVLANMPIHRFLATLLHDQTFEPYMDTLAAHFNPSAFAKVMCKSQLSVAWDGRVFDCDFNQMLELPSPNFPTLADITVDALARRGIRYANHCYGCTAGAGSSCGGSLT